MNDIIMSALIGTLVGGAGTAAGAVAAFAVKRPNKQLPFMMMALSGGIMLAIVFFDMIPEAVHFAGVWPVVIGGLLGALFVFLAHLVIPHHKAGRGAEGEKPFDADKITRTGLMLCAGIAIHNLPEGLAIGSGLTSPENYGFTLAILLLVHNLPEGMAMSLPLLIGGVKRSATVLLALAAGMPTAVGAVIGVLVGGVSQTFIGGAIAFAAGAMLYLTVFELLPQTMRRDKRLTMALFILAGVAVGYLMTALVGHEH